MFKGIVITLLFIIVSAINLSATSNLGMYYNKSNKFIGIYPLDGAIRINENYQDWVAVYPTNASNDWNNVIQWAWVRDLDSYTFKDGGVTKYTKMFDDEGLDQGSYEVRYFLNNTFNTYKSKNFDIGIELESPYIKTTNQTSSKLYIKSAHENDQTGYTWIGIYKVGDNNEWKNVKSWSWVTKDNVELDIRNLAKGTYEARLFYNNSYNVETKIEFEVVGDNDKYHLFQNLDISRNNGRIVVKNGNDTLMDTPESAILDKFNDLTNGLDVVYRNFEEVIGGFNYNIKIVNTTNKPLNLNFKINIPQIRFSNIDNKINVLNTMTYMTPIKQIIGEGVESRINKAGSSVDYPTSYSPVIVAHDDKFAVGASILTTFIDDEIALEQYVKHNNNNNGWNFVFKSSGFDAGGVGMSGLLPKKLAGGETYEFKLTIRFADIRGNKKDNWKYTLAPYKKFFNNRFSNKHIIKRDTRPILGMTFSYESNAEYYHGNGESMYINKGYGLYGPNGRYFDNGNTQRYANELFDKLKDGSHNYKRLMFWSVSGMYYERPKSKDGNGKGNLIDINIPSQFLGNLEPNIVSILNGIKNKFKNSDINYGFWWGRSGQIPIKNGQIISDNEWNPDTITPSDINNIDYGDYHFSFAKNQLQKALNYGATEIGLDAFANMKTSAQLDWARAIKKDNVGKNFKFMQEGRMSDYLHTEFSMYLQPKTLWFNKVDSKFKSKPILADYLNPEAEIIVWITNPKNEEYINQLRSYGFTPLLNIPNGNIRDIPLYNGK